MNFPPRYSKNSLFSGLLAAIFVMHSVPALAGNAEGKAAYQKHCQACHQANGAGVTGAFPPLADNENIANNSSYLAQAIVKGVTGPIEVQGKKYNGYMPALKHLSNGEVVKVVGYIMSDLNNGEASISETDVEAMR